MDLCELNMSHIFIGIALVVFIILSIMNSVYFLGIIIVAEDMSHRILRWFITIITLVSALIFPVMYIMTICGYYTPIIDFIANAGG